MHRTTRVERKMPMLVGAAVLGFAVLTASPGSAQRESSSLSEANAIAERMLAEQTHPLIAALQRVDRAQQELATRAGSSDGDQPAGPVLRYAEAVSDLRRFPDAETLPAVLTAIQSAEAEVRRAGLRALRGGAASRNPNHPALLAARDLVVSDSSAGVRREAFEAYCRWGNQDDVLALSQQLGREAGPVRDLAVREWLRIERERSQR